ncbi:uncharacterized protein [Nicotiana tomentosiformis]|uniref:uncharacterized protein n=1 Tax=Nicotiana tomentosiformis TaxID=4098 RepID=UPI00388CC8E4
MLKETLKQLNNQEFNSIGHKIQLSRNKLEGIQAQMPLSGNNTEAILQENAAKLELKKWLEFEESVLKQKSRIQWFKLGDSNTSYLYACVKNKQAKNHICRLTNSVGQILQSAIEVEEEILNFYKKNYLGDEVTAAVMEFYENAEMCKAINCTTITLIPKVKNPTNIKEFRPIFCCTRGHTISQDTPSIVSKPKSASWDIQKIFKARNYFEVAGYTEKKVNLMERFSIRHIYKAMQGEFQKVP